MSERWPNRKAFTRRQFLRSSVFGLVLPFFKTSKIVAQSAIPTQEQIALIIQSGFFLNGIAFGSSITAGVNLTDRSYVEALGQKLNIPTNNQGVGASISDQQLVKITNYYRDQPRQIASGSFAMIDLGINDNRGVGTGSNGEKIQADYDYFRSNVQQIVQILLSHNQYTFLLLPPEIIDSKYTMPNWDKGTASSRLQYIDIINSVAQSHRESWRIPVVDVKDMGYDPYDPYQCTDGVHPTFGGCERFANAILRQMYSVVTDQSSHPTFQFLPNIVVQ